MPYTEDDKRLFAEALLKGSDDPYKVAFSLFENDTLKAIKLSEWSKESPSELKEIQNELISNQDEGEMAFIPSKADYLRQLWENAINTMYPPEVREKYFKQFGEATKYLSKETESSSSKITNNIMVMQSHGDNDNWERELRANQEALINDP